MKRKHAQRKRQPKSSPRSRPARAPEKRVSVLPEKRISVLPGKRISVVPARRSLAPAGAAALREDGAMGLDECPELDLALAGASLDTMLARAAQHDSGEIEISPRAHVFSQVDMHTESNFYSGYSGDLSDGGVFVVTYAPLKLGQAVDVELSLPGGLFISATGRVAFLRAPSQHNADLAPGVGIVLDELEPRARHAAESFMLRREPTFVDPN